MEPLEKPEFEFVSEISPFDVNSYLPHMGWISSSPTDFKIYRSENSSNYFLHDEKSDQLFEFSYIEGRTLKEKSQFEAIIEGLKLLGN
ncbi:hypothetical protein LZD49_33315 [Dyadobacter sp. CY261]|uniref:hypothetical protein n=1 Tax=Dyadobacter sp. CY261 TaxID=2907203 RepID=UPI001F171800|nr:hypothetical protein [Dyadobacter sp. CY261]MCF0075406.1 hypothetical protein [Dyadobacter sp. CY261]